MRNRGGIPAHLGKISAAIVLVFPTSAMISSEEILNMRPSRHKSTLFEKDN